MTNEKRNDGARLAELIAQKNIPLPAFYSILAQFGYASRATQSKFIAAQTLHIPKNDLCLICSLFGFRPEDFGYQPDYFKSQYSHKDAALFCYNHRKEGDKEYRPFIERFFEEVNIYLLKVEQELLVCDYLDKVRGIEQKENKVYYHQHNMEYYEALEGHFAKKTKENPESPIAYKRLVQIPLGAQVSSFEEALDFVIEEMFPESFAHLCRCLRDFKTQCEFYVVVKPFRLHTTYIVDRKVALTEYHRYDREGTPIPDTLFVNIREPGDDEAVGSIYLNSCMDEFERMKYSNRNSRMTIPNVINSIFSMQDRIQAQIDALEKEIHEAVHPGHQQKILQYAQEAINGQKDKVPESLLSQLKDWAGQEKRMNQWLERQKNIRQKMKILVDTLKIEPPAAFSTQNLAR